MATRDILEQAGGYNLEKVEIISYRKQGEEQTLYHMNIKPITIHIELKEDIFTNYIMGRIRVMDAQDVRTLLPITGLEKLNLKFNTPGRPGYNADEEGGHPYQIYKIDKVQQDETNPRMQSYSIYFCSQEMYYNAIHRVSQAFEGSTEIGVEEILRNDRYLSSSKAFFYEPTATNTKVVIPNLKPFDAINFLSKITKSQKYKNSGYLFYETANGFHFRSLESMYAVKGTTPRPIKQSYVNQVMNTTDGKGVRDVLQDMRSVTRFEFKKPVNMIENLTRGMIANKMFSHDAFNKTVKTTTYDYAQQFEDYFHMEHTGGQKSVFKTLIPFAFFDDTYMDLSGHADARHISVSQTSKIHNDYELPSHEDRTQTAIPQRVSIGAVELDLEVYGDTTIHAGDMIKFTMPIMQPLGETGKQRNSPYWTGRYLVTGVKHDIFVEEQRHMMLLQCSKDSVAEQFPPSYEDTHIPEPNGITADIYELDNSIPTDMLEDLDK